VRSILLTFIGMVLFLVGVPAFSSSAEGPSPSPTFFVPKTSAFRLREPERERSDTLVPIASFLIPGFGQWVEGQYEYAAGYSLGAVAAVAYGSYHRRKVDAAYRDDTNDELLPRNSSHNTHPGVLRTNLGYQTYFTLSCFSTYHSFRSAVRTAKNGRYSFLLHEESPADLALAPFNFSYVLRPTTFVPLLIGAGILASTLAASRNDLEEHGKERSYQNENTLMAVPLSYNAGTGEEALFRGWFMPLLRANTGSDFYANGINALVFGLGHLSATNRAPLFQAAFGYYLGYLSQRNGWSLGEGIFIHAWWDFFVVSASYAVSSLDKRRASPIIWFPPLEISF
jgi:membrane protease YdiL (CAAX protease family)